MLYHLFQYLDSLNFPGAGIFQYITFRSGCAIILSLFIAMVFGKKVIRILQKQQIGEEIRDLGLEGQTEIFYRAQWPLFMLLPALGSALYLIPFLCIRYSKAQKERVERELAERREHAQEESARQA